MTGEVVNLNKARKARAKAMSKEAAAANRIAFGRTKAQKTRDAAEVARSDGLLDGARRED